MNAFTVLTIVALVAIGGLDATGLSPQSGPETDPDAELIPEVIISDKREDPRNGGLRLKREATVVSPAHLNEEDDEEFVIVQRQEGLRTRGIRMKRSVDNLQANPDEMVIWEKNKAPLARSLRVKRQADDVETGAVEGNKVMVQAVENRQHFAFRNTDNENYNVRSRRYSRRGPRYYGGGRRHYGGGWGYGDYDGWDSDEDDDDDWSLEDRPFRYRRFYGGHRRPHHG